MSKFNKIVKKANSKVEYTKNKILKFEKCMNDFYAFCEYIKIVHPDHGKIKFNPR
jgi:hypothetical protein